MGFQSRNLAHVSLRNKCNTKMKNKSPSNTKIIAEIGCNHMGDLAIAKDLIKEAAGFCHVDVVKFQKRCPRELLSPTEYNTPHPVPANAFGQTYGEHREALEFTIDQHRELKEYAESFGTDYASSVWDMTSAQEIASLNPKLIKIPSACNTNRQILNFLCDNYSGEIHISVGMTTREEEDQLVKFFCQKNRVKDLVIYSCTSGYPVADEDVCLLEIPRLQASYGQTVKAIGFSGHHLGIAIDIAALALGAQWIERHFTLNRIWKGTDHAASLEPDGMRRLVRDVMSVSKTLTEKATEMLPIEEIQRKKLKRFVQ